MSIEEADEIRDRFGKFMEIANPQLSKFFLGSIPESLLPYPKEKIDEAMDICIEYFQEQQNLELVNVFELLQASLAMYVDDEEAILKAHKRMEEK